MLAHLIVFSAALSLTSSALAEPVTVTPGDGTVDGSFIGAYENSWTVTNRDAEGNESPGGRWTDQMETIDWRGTSALKRTQRVYGPDDALQSVVVHTVEHASLAPLVSHNYTPAGGMTHQDYDGATITGVLLRDDQSPAIYVDSTLDAPAYNWNIFGTLVLGFPLDVGYEAKFPAFNLVPNGKPMGSPEFGFTAATQWHELHVTGAEPVSAGARGEVEALIVEVPQARGLFRFYLTKEAPYIIKLVYEQADGSVTTWEME